MASARSRMRRFMRLARRGLIGWACGIRLGSSGGPSHPGSSRSVLRSDFAFLGGGSRRRLVARDHRVQRTAPARRSTRSRPRPLRPAPHSAASLSSICITARFTCSMPMDCSRLAEAISATIVVTFFTAPTIPSSVRPDSSTSREPSDTRRHAVLNECLDLLRGRRAAPRKAAHLTRHHRKSAPLLARARRFDGRVQRKQIRLERDLVDHADDVGDLARRRIDATHRMTAAPTTAPPFSACAQASIAS